MKWKTFIALCVIVTVQGDEEDLRVVKTRQGPVQGRKDPVGVYVYTNIPYATMPKGPHKFDAPLPGPAWLQTLEVSEKRIACPQPKTAIINPEKVTVQEDCLIANVYVPDTDEKKLPVIVYVHGGAFEMGFGDMITPKNFVKKHKVIVVTFNYRLGVHGFLCLGTNSIAGNAGLKDQVALLRWVQKNIESFGGDPENVSIAGYSAGSVSVDLLMLSKSTKGLFNKIILESGAGVGSIATQQDPLENAKSYAKDLNFTDVDDFYALEEFYKSSSLDSLLRNTFFDRKDASLLFGPCVERKGNSAFIDESPVEIIKKGTYKKIPIVLGVSSMEGLLQIANFENWRYQMSEKFSDFLPADLQFADKDEKEEVAKAVKEFYFGDGPVNEAKVLSYIDYVSDVYFTYPTLRTVRMHAENDHKDIYLYEYSFVDNDAPVVPHTNVKGAAHCAQTMAIFDGPGLFNDEDENKISEDFKKMKDTMRELWYNFAAHSKPVPEGSSLPSWPSADANRSPYMSLGQTVELQGPMVEARAQFWDGIYQKYYRNPLPPPAPPHTEL